MHVRVKMMSKGSKEALTVLIITHVTQIERVESGVCGSYTTPYADVFTTGQSEEAALLSFLDLSTTRVIAGKTHSQSPVLTLTKGALSNPVILTYLWEQSCILHTLTKTACLCKF